MTSCRRRRLRVWLAGAAVGGAMIASGATPALPGPGSPPWRFTYLRSDDGGRSFTPLQLADAGIEAQQTRVVAGDGTVHALFDDFEPQPRRVFYRRSTDQGRSFSASVRLDTPRFGAAIEVGDSGEAAIAASGTDVHVAWEDDRVLPADFPLPAAVRLRSDIVLSDGTTIDSETPPGPDDDDDSNNTVLLSGFVFPAGSVDPRTDSAFFAIGESRASRSTRQENRDEIHYSRSTDGGARFTAPINLTDSADVHDRDPVIGAEGRHVVLAYEGIDEVSAPAATTGDDVFLARSTDGGDTWVEVNRNLTPGEPGDQDEPGLALAGSDVTVAFRTEQGGPRRIGWVHSKDGGATFSAPTALPTTASAGAEHTTPEVHASGPVVLVAACENDEGAGTFKLLLWTSTDAGDTFPAAPTVLDEGTGECDKPAVDGAGSQLHLVYERETASAQSDIHLVSSPDGGATWGRPRDLSANGQDSKDPTVSVDPSDAGHVHVGWSDRSDFLFSLRFGQDLPLEDGEERRVANEDVIRYVGGAYQLVLDGSDVGLRRFRIDGLARLSPMEFLLSFTERGTVPGVGMVDDSDIVAFRATRLGENTAGVFSLWFDGSDVGLTEEGEDVDAIEFRNGDLYLSTAGSFSTVGDATGENEDIFECVAVTAGPDSSCARIDLLFDGSVIGLGHPREAIDAFAFNGVDPTPFRNEDGELEVNETSALFSFRHAWHVPTASGGGSDLARCVFPGAIVPGDEAASNLSDCGAGVPLHAVFSGAANLLEQNIHALELDF